MPQKNETLLEFESKTGLGSTSAARLLGVAYVTYAQYRSMSRVLPQYHINHIEVLLLLPAPALSAVIRRNVHGKL